MPIPAKCASHPAFSWRITTYQCERGFRCHVSVAVKGRGRASDRVRGSRGRDTTKRRRSRHGPHFDLRRDHGRTGDDTVPPYDSHCRSRPLTFPLAKLADGDDRLHDGCLRRACDGRCAPPGLAPYRCAGHREACAGHRARGVHLSAGHGRPERAAGGPPAGAAGHDRPLDRPAVRRPDDRPLPHHQGPVSDLPTPAPRQPAGAPRGRPGKLDQCAPPPRACACRCCRARSRPY